MIENSHFSPRTLRRAPRDERRRWRPYAWSPRGGLRRAPGRSAEDARRTPPCFPTGHALRAPTETRAVCANSRATSGSGAPALVTRASTKRRSDEGFRRHDSIARTPPDRMLNDATPAAQASREPRDRPMAVGRGRFAQHVERRELDDFDQADGDQVSTRTVMVLDGWVEPGNDRFATSLLQPSTSSGFDKGGSCPATFQVAATK